MSRYLTQKLKLVVNDQKSQVCPTSGVKFLGFRLTGYGGKAQVSEKNQKKFKEKVRFLLNHNRGISMTRRLRELGRYLRGWIGYFALEHRKSLFTRLDKWIRRRVRACYWKQWRLPRTRIRQLKAHGVRHKDAVAFGNSRKGPWRLSKTSGLQSAFNNEYLQARGLVSLLDRWSELASLR